MRRFNLYGILAAALLLSACTKPGKVIPGQDDGYNSPDATFRIETGEVDGISDPVIEGDRWQKPFSVTVQYTACLRERANDSAILNQKFHIEDPEAKARVETATTSPKGCLTWNEPLPFNYFALRSRWVTIERDIVGAGIYSGKRRVTFAVNPWLISSRVEMKPAKAGYFLRDEPLDLTNPSAREASVYEFFEKSWRTQNKGRAFTPEEQKTLAEWKSTLQYGYAKQESLLVPAKLSQSALAGREGAAGIWIDSVKPVSIKRRNISVEIDDDGKDKGDRGYLVEQVLQIQPRIRIRKADGSVEYEDLRNGTFDVYAHVMGTDLGKQQDQRIILTKSVDPAVAGGTWKPGDVPKGNGRIVDGKLYVSLQYEVTRTSAEGNAELVLKLVPREIAVRSPETFEGVFLLGKISTWVGTSTPALIDVDRCVPREDGTMNPDKTCKFDAYLSQSGDYEQMLAEGAIRKAQSYFFTNIKPRFVQVMQGSVSANDKGELVVLNGETATHRTVFYAASTCVTASTGERMSGATFTIQYKPVYRGKQHDKDDDGNEARANLAAFPVTADDNGCLNWNNTVSHAYYKAEKFFKQIIEIQGPHGFRRQKTVYINPWDDKFTFGFDEEELGKEFFERNANSHRINSRFYLGDYSYHTVRFLYEIDSNMDLEVKKTVLMDLSPRVLRYSGLISGRKLTESLRDGIYLLKVGIQKSYLDPSDRFHKLCEVDRARQIQNQDGTYKQITEKATIDDPNLCKLSRDQRYLSLDDQAKAAKARENSVETLNENVVTKEFVTTKTTLVRITDGLVIHPVELSMKDLRLMRIRSNFLVQLETVDESKVLLNDELSKQYRELIAHMVTESRAKKEEFRAQTAAQATEETVDQDRSTFENEIRARAETARASVTQLYKNELERLNKMTPIISDFNSKGGDLNELLARFSKVENPWTYFMDGGKLNEDEKAQYDRYSLYRKMAQNDFTSISLPDCDRVDCSKFKQTDSGLEKRTFVGPVIFLSNSYKDAVRATDNLDEARCHEEIEGADFVKSDLPPLEADLLDFETSILTDESHPMVKPTNTAYRYSRYFNSLRHFCTTVTPGENGERPRVQFEAKHVDDLIKEEKELNVDYQGKMKALATPYNLASIHNLDFVSYGGEKLKKIDDKLTDDSCLKNGVDTCMVETTERTLQPSDLKALANRDLQNRVSWVPSWPFSDYFPMFNPVTRKSEFTDDEIKNAVLGQNYKGDDQAAVCSILTSMASDNARKLLPGLTSDAAVLFESLTFAECVAQGKKGFIRDNKLRIYQTGGYEFKGGLQMNFNVGSSFGVSRSEGVSTSVDFFDAGILAGGAAGAMVGGLPGAAVGALAGYAAKILKPLDFKTSRSMSESKGTSIAEGTYLVGQIAKFKIPLKEWEECTVLRLRPDAVQALANKIDGARLLSRYEFGSQAGAELYSAFHKKGEGQITGLNTYQAHMNAVFSRGLFICDGQHRTTSVNSEGQMVAGRDIDELYFYFTQHFTEGDMLDQADLYNHPWLLSLRGLRDFSAFVELIRGQEAGSIMNFVNGLIGNRPESDTAGWSLAHMANTYKAIIPSFPGLYTVLEQGEGMDFFTLDDKKFSEFDQDINSEVKAGSMDPAAGQ